MFCLHHIACHHITSSVWPPGDCPRLRFMLNVWLCAVINFHIILLLLIIISQSYQQWWNATSIVVLLRSSTCHFQTFASFCSSGESSQLLWPCPSMLCDYSAFSARRLDWKHPRGTPRLSWLHAIKSDLHLSTLDSVLTDTHRIVWRWFVETAVGGLRVTE